MLLDFGESSLEYICPVSPLQSSTDTATVCIFFHWLFCTVLLDFGESSFEYIRPVSPLQSIDNRYCYCYCYCSYIFLLTTVLLDLGESSLECIRPVSPLQSIDTTTVCIFFHWLFCNVFLDFGESPLEYICPVRPLQKWYCYCTFLFPLTILSCVTWFRWVLLGI